jgi:hypothetical protein
MISDKVLFPIFKVLTIISFLQIRFVPKLNFESLIKDALRKKGINVGNFEQFLIERSSWDYSRKESVDVPDPKVLKVSGFEFDLRKGRNHMQGSTLSAMIGRLTRSQEKITIVIMGK